LIGNQIQSAVNPVETFENAAGRGAARPAGAPAA